MYKHLHKQGDAGVGHGVGQSQDAAAHDGVAKVEDGHAEGGIALMLRREKKDQDQKMKRINGMLKEVKSDGGWHTYIFSLILLLAQVLFREEVLTLSFVNVWALKKERKL